MNAPDIVAASLRVALFGPLTALVVLGAAALLRRPPSERNTVFLVEGMSWIVLSALTVAGAAMALGESWRIVVSLGHMIDVPGYRAELRLVLDPLSLCFAWVAAGLCGVVSAFAGRYLHREPGFVRFFLLFSAFEAGMLLAVLGGTIGLMYVGWELLGLSSAALIAYFYERPTPVRSAIWAWSTYRISDIGLLSAGVLLHHWSGSDGLEIANGGATWPGGTTILTAGQASLVGLLLVLSVAGKSALFPLGAWLPRSMEGPTPSSAIFYGAVSIHAGIYVLLRVEPILRASPWAPALLVGLGTVTAIFATVIERTQTDIKGALVYGALTQVGLIVVEVGLGFSTLALIHTLGHALLRSLQFLRAPSMLHDLHVIENAVGHHLSVAESRYRNLVPRAWIRELYVFGLQRGHLEAFFVDVVVQPVLRVGRFFDRLERGWIDVFTPVQRRGRAFDRAARGGGEPD